MRHLVVIDTVRGLAFIGDVSIPVREAGRRGEIQVGGSGGPILRPLTFGERSRLVTRAAASPAALDIVCAGVLQAATMQPGHADRFVQEILALTLAGADQEAPGFAETVLLVAQAARWELSQLYEAEATEVDRLAIALVGFPSDSGWTRIVFAQNEETLESIRRELGERLLQRGDPVAGATTLEHTPAARTLSLFKQTPVHVNAAQASLSGEPASRTFDGTLTTPAQRDLPSSLESASPSPTSVSIPNVRVAKPPYVRIRVPELMSKESAARRSTRGASARDRQTDRPLLRWSLLPNGGARDGTVLEVALKQKESPLAQNGFTATAPLETLAPRAGALQNARLRVRDELPAASRNSTPVLQSTIEGICHTSDSLTVPSAGVQIVMRALEKPAPIEQSATLANRQPLFSDWSEAADALAALLDHEADLRGIE